MRPQVSRPFFHLGASLLFEPCPGAAYAEFVENRHKLHGDLDGRS